MERVKPAIGVARKVTHLVGELRDCLDHPERDVPLGLLLERLEEVRCRLDHEARKNAGETVADETGTPHR